MGFVFSVFALSYGLFEVPMGWLSDLWGQRNTMTRIVACWSAFTALTGLAFSYRALVTVRFCFGAAEAGAFPTLAQALARWFPVHERGRVNGLMWMGARIGGAVSPSLAVLLIGAAGWRATFFLFGLIGVAWCLAILELVSRRSGYPPRRERRGTGLHPRRPGGRTRSSE